MRRGRGGWSGFPLVRRAILGKNTFEMEDSERPFTAELEQEFARRAKKQLRVRMKALRSGYPLRALEARGQALVERVRSLSEYHEAEGVALFWPLVERGEVDLRPLCRELFEQGVRVYFPFMTPSRNGFRTGFRLVGSESELSDQGRGFLEPPPTGPVAVRGEIDLVFVPALAFDARGQRLGYGAGYYDATLGDVAPPARTLGVGYDFQLLAELPREDHDVALDIVVTDRQTLRFG